KPRIMESVSKTRETALYSVLENAVSQGDEGFAWDVARGQELVQPVEFAAYLNDRRRQVGEGLNDGRWGKLFCWYVGVSDSSQLAVASDVCAVVKDVVTETSSAVNSKQPGVDDEHWEEEVFILQVDAETHDRVTNLNAYRQAPRYTKPSGKRPVD